jgi:hypothetical protein
MMNMARMHYRQARRIAAAIGAEALAGWLGEQEATATELTLRESDSAGYVVRAHQLSGWAMEVFG